MIVQYAVLAYIQYIPGLTVCFDKLCKLHICISQMSPWQRFHLPQSKQLQPHTGSEYQYQQFSLTGSEYQYQQFSLTQALNINSSASQALNINSLIF